MPFKCPHLERFTPTEFDHAVHVVAKYWNVLVVGSIQYIKRFLFNSVAKKLDL